MIIILIFIIVLIICFFILNNYTKDKINYHQIENYSPDLINLKNFTFNVITLHNHDRLTNISEQEKILVNIQINKFNAIRGIELNQDKLVEDKILSTNFKYPSAKRSNEIGCYLSHLELLKSL